MGSSILRFLELYNYVMLSSGIKLQGLWEAGDLKESGLGVMVSWRTMPWLPALAVGKCGPKAVSSDVYLKFPN